MKTRPLAARESFSRQAIGVLFTLVTVLGALLSATPRPARANDYPHTNVNDIGCPSCHQEGGSLPGWTDHVPQSIDDTPENNLCWSCHNDREARYVRTHSSLATGTKYGNWSMQCTSCHDQHKQDQVRTYGEAAYLFSGVSTAVSNSTFTMDGAGWMPNQWVGNIVVGNTSDPELSYRIIANTADTLGVGGTIDQEHIHAGDQFAIVYGKLIRDTVATPASGTRAVRFFRDTGGNSFSDGDGNYDGVCEVCHTQTNHFRNDGGAPDQTHANIGGGAGRNCTGCHTHVSGFAGHGGGGGGGGCGTATSCHGTQESHPTHVGPSQLGVDCAECHDTNSFPRFKDGQDLAGTTACDNCHSANGVALAKQYWDSPGSSSGTPGSWAVVQGEKSYCGSCHESSPGNSRGDGTGDLAPNIIGDDSTYGFYVTGHGKETGNYARLSWQQTSASGNPAAATPCSFCHDLAMTHFDTPTKRLRAGFENDQANTNCRNCHSWDGSEGTTATAEPHFYTTSAQYENSAHGGLLCTRCHDVHGGNGAYAGMTRSERQSLCYQCHTAGGVPNDAISGPSTSTNIEHAFGLLFRHALGVSFPADGLTYSLECVSCHNVHVVTGKYWDAAQGQSPITRFRTNTALWGASSGEKMGDYVGSGTYQIPNGDPFAGDVLPDYVTSCADCHNESNTIYSPTLGRNLYQFDWSSEKHGRAAAGQCSTAFNAPYDRAMLGRYVLACTDCHEAHGSTNSLVMRTRVNGGDVIVTEYGDGNGGAEWDSLCGKCHDRIPDAHHGSSGTPCSTCHPIHGGPMYTNCSSCHYHQDTSATPVITCTPAATPTNTPAPSPTPTATPG